MKPFLLFTFTFALLLCAGCQTAGEKVTYRHSRFAVPWWSLRDGVAIDQETHETGHKEIVIDGVAHPLDETHVSEKTLIELLDETRSLHP